MKKLFFVLLCMMLTFSLFGEEISTENTREQGGFDLNLYYSNSYSVGSLSDYLIGKVGGGASLEYTLHTIPFLGFSGRLEFEGGIPTSTRIGSWNELFFAGGVYANLPFARYFSFRPELSYGLIANFVVLDGKSSVFVDQIIQIAASFRLSNKEFYDNGLSLEIAPVYTLSTEKTDAIHNLGFRTGLTYHFN